MTAPRLACILVCLALTSLPTTSKAQTPSESARHVTSANLTTLTDIDALSISPDGRWAVFQTRQADPRANRHEQQWRVVSTAGGASRRIADAGDPILLGALGRLIGTLQTPRPVWSPDSQWVAFLRQEGGRTQVWRAHLGGQRVEQLTHGAGDARAPVFSSDGQRLLFEIEPSQVQLDAALAREGRAGFLYDNRFFPLYSKDPIMPADTVFGAGGAHSATDAREASQRLFVYDFTIRRERSATDDEQAEFAALAAGPRPNQGPAFYYMSAASEHDSLAWTEARDPERQGGLAPLTIVAKPSGASEPVVCHAAECTTQVVNGLWWRNDAELLFARRAPDSPDATLYAWRVDEPAPRLVLRTEGVFSSSAEWRCSVGQGRLICFYEEPARPRRLVAIDLDSGTIETLYDPNPDFAGFDLGPVPQRLEFVSRSGLQTTGHLVLPPQRREGERLPVVVVTYNCAGFLRGGTGDEYPIFPMAAEGHAVLCLNFSMDRERLATMDFQSYGNWLQGPGDPGRRRNQEILEAALADLDRRGVIDPDRIGITGLSAGGEIVAYALFHLPRLTAAIASGPSGAEPSNLFTMGPAAREVLRSYGLSSSTSARWNDIALSRNAQSVRAAFLLNVADREMLATLDPVAALQTAGRSVEMYVFPDEHHIKWQPAHRLAIYNRNIDWMNFWLRGVESNLTGDASQYERWRATRENQCRLFGPGGAEYRADAVPWYCRPGALEEPAH